MTFSPINQNLSSISFTGFSFTGLSSLRVNKTCLQLAFVLALSFCLSFQNDLQAQTLRDVVPEVQSKIVKLYGAGGVRNLANYGTGFLVSSDGHIITVWSHLLDSSTVSVVLADGRRFYGQVVGTNSESDLALIKIDVTQLPHFQLDLSSTAGPGTPVLAFSNVFKVAVGDEPVSIMHGIVSAKTSLNARRGRYQIPYQGLVYLIDAVTNNPGAAGGVLTNYQGQLIGILGREVRSDQNHIWVNYAVPIEDLKTAIEDLIAGRSRRVDPLDEMNQTEPARLHALDLGIVLVPDVVFRTPAYIETTVPGSQAAEHGLQTDDLIVFANGDLVHSIRTLNGVFKNLSPGDDLQLIVRRGQELISMTFRVPGP